MNVHTIYELGVAFDEIGLGLLAPQTLFTWSWSEELVNISEQWGFCRRMDRMHCIVMAFVACIFRAFRLVFLLLNALCSQCRSRAIGGV